MKHVQETTYLGASVSKRVDPRQEIRKRISATMVTLKKLDIFWLKTNCSQKWKLLVYNAVVISKLLYGLETLEPTESAGKLLNTFQLKGLRKSCNCTLGILIATTRTTTCIKELMKSRMPQSQVYTERSSPSQKFSENGG